MKRTATIIDDRDGTFSVEFNTREEDGLDYIQDHENHFVSWHKASDAAFQWVVHGLITEREGQ